VPHTDTNIPTWLKDAGYLNLVDIGAGGGITALARIAQIVDAHGFDPNATYLEQPSEAQYLRKRGLGTSPNYRSSTLHPFAISVTSGERDFYFTASPSDGSFLEPDLESINTISPKSRIEDFRVLETKPVATITIDDWINKHNVADITYMKVDTQGTENEILSSIGEKNSPHIIYTEAQIFPLYKGQSTFADIFQTLTARGYVLLTADAVPVIYTSAPRSQHRIGHYNASFVLDLSNASDDAKTKQIAALAVDQHIDYASHLLSKYGLPQHDLSSLTPKRSLLRRIARKILR